MRDVLIVHSQVSLMRNYPDIPFDTRQNPEDAARVISRTRSALQGRGFALHLLRDMSQDRHMALLEAGQIPLWVRNDRGTSAVMLPLDGSACVTLCGTAHVAIAAKRPGSALPEAAEACFAIDDALSRRVSFAFDEELGYLQGQYGQMGTGMNAGMRVHLPLLLRSPQMEEIRKEAQRAGVQFFVPSAGKKNEFGILDVMNASALGMTESEICQLVSNQVQKLCDMERELRQKALRDAPLALEDKVWRAYGLLQTARVLGQEEFWRLWSDVRLGAALELLPVAVDKVDGLVPEALVAHLRSYAEEALTGEDLDACRAARVRELLGEKPLL
ncbi:MAG: hypothetical protein IKK57_10710 [Clostridia bacterium]|nr:hypothetical protein [Clostridia bacterium]